MKKRYTSYRAVSYAKKYAYAFLNVFYPKPHQLNILTFKKLLAFFVGNQRIFLTLAYSSAGEAEVLQVIDRLGQKFALTSAEHSLFLTLLRLRRTDFLLHVLRAIINVEKDRRGEVACKIETSHELTEKEQEYVTSFMKEKVERRGVPHFGVNSHLICGIRILSKNHLWERSVRRKLLCAESLVYKLGAI
jgi:F0F1-type ATP synthase delta subunit